MTAESDGRSLAGQSLPVSAKLIVDGRELEERTPLKVPDLSPGDHTIRVEKGTGTLRVNTRPCSQV